MRCALPGRNRDDGRQFLPPFGAKGREDAPRFEARGAKPGAAAGEHVAPPVTEGPRDEVHGLTAVATFGIFEQRFARCRPCVRVDAGYPRSRSTVAQFPVNFAHADR